MEFDEKLKLHSGTRRAEVLPRKWYRISFLILLSGLAGIFIAAYVGRKTGVAWPVAVCLLWMLLSLPVLKITCRCPCCGSAKHTKYMCWSGYNEMYCQKCGAVLVYDDDPDKDRDLDEVDAEKRRQEQERLERQEENGPQDETP